MEIRDHRARQFEKTYLRVLSKVPYSLKATVMDKITKDTDRSWMRAVRREKRPRRIFGVKCVTRGFVSSPLSGAANQSGRGVLS